MIIVPGETIELEYRSSLYTFRVVSVVEVASGFDVDIIVPVEFKVMFKRGENLARWSHQRFQKFFINSLKAAQHAA